MARTHRQRRRDRTATQCKLLRGVTVPRARHDHGKMRYTNTRASLLVIIAEKRRKPSEQNTESRIGDRPDRKPAPPCRAQPHHKPQRIPDRRRPSREARRRPAKGWQVRSKLRIGVAAVFAFGI
jgi:hypothetical protein